MIDSRGRFKTREGVIFHCHRSCCFGFRNDYCIQRQRREAPSHMRSTCRLHEQSHSLTNVLTLHRRLQSPSPSRDTLRPFVVGHSLPLSAQHQHMTRRAQDLADPNNPFSDLPFPSQKLDLRASTSPTAPSIVGGWSSRSASSRASLLPSIVVPAYRAPTRASKNTR